MMNVRLFMPELYALLAAGVFLVLSLRPPRPLRDYGIAFFISAAGLLTALLTVGHEALLFHGVYRIDLFSQVFKILISMGFFLVICLCRDLSGVEEKRHSEFYLLLSVCTLAMMLLVSSVHLLTLYISLELSSYSLYVLVYLRKGYEKGLEAALKYFIVGASASAVMLFGFALLYGSGQSAYLADLARHLPGRLNEPVVLIGFILALSGFFFKLAIFPFHIWAPDVYEGAPHQVSAYLATASKIAAIAILMRITALGSGASDRLAWFLIVLSVLSMTVGNLAAIAQKDLKRLLAFSSVAHAGYVTIGILSANALGYASTVFYALSLLVMKFSCFLIVVKAADGGRNITVEQLAGLHRRAPVLALAFFLALFGLAGIPPTIGFTAKLLIFSAAMKKGLLWLVLVAMFNVLISLYFYLNVLKAAYFIEPAEAPPAIAVSLPLNILAVVLIVTMVIGGIYPRYLIALAGVMTKGLMLTFP